MREDDSRDFRELFTRNRLQIVLAGIKEDVTHVDDQAARSVAGFENPVQLLGELLAKLLLFTLGLLSCFLCALEFSLGGLTVAGSLCGSRICFGTCLFSLCFGLGTPLRLQTLLFLRLGLLFCGFVG